MIMSKSSMVAVIATTTAGDCVAINILFVAKFALAVCEKMDRKGPGKTYLKIGYFILGLLFLVYYDRISFGKRTSARYVMDGKSSDNIILVHQQAPGGP